MECKDHSKVLKDENKVIRDVLAWPEKVYGLGVDDKCTSSLLKG